MKKVLILLLWLLPSCSVVIFAQTQRIAGTVVVGDGQPAVGAAIVVKGTNIGAVTNVDGKFVIAEAPASAQRLVVYHVGMERKEVDVAPNVYIQLQPVEQGFSWNVKAGVSLFSYRRPDGLDERTGFSVGAGVEYNFSRHWAIQSGLMITSKGATAEYEGYSPLSSSTDPISYKAKISPIYRVPTGTLTDTLPISSLHSSSLIAPSFLLLGRYELDFSLNSLSQTAFISPLRAFSPLLDKVYTRFHEVSSGTGYARIEVNPCPSTSIMRNAGRSSGAGALTS